MEQKRDFLINALHIFVLFSFALAQPLFDLLSRNATFFVVHRSEPVDIILLILIVCVLLPALVVLIEVVTGLIGRRARKAVHGFMVAGLVVIIALPVLNKIFKLPGIAIVVGAAIVGVTVTIAYIRFNQLRLFLTILSPALLIFPGLFLFNSPVSKVIFAGDAFRTIPEVHADTPIVFVVFDALSLTSLMNEDREIDPVRYPNFAALARNATWFRNATTVSDYTHMACPAMLSGIYPDKPRLPTAIDYPHNIFTLLGGSYNLIVDDPNTQLCPDQLCGKWAGHGNHESSRERISSLLLDLSVVYLHIVLPSDLRAGLPVVTRSWKDFIADDRAKPEKRAKQKSLTPLKKDYWLNYVTGERPRQLVRFIKSIDYSKKPTLYYLHIVIPHEPWRYLPSGKEYSQPAEYKIIRGLSEFGIGETWSSDEWAVVQAWQRYLLQVGFVDRLLGEIIDRIKTVGLYDRSLIVVTADHGVSFRPNDKRRPITKTNYQDIMCVPLFIKAPNQHEGVISDRNLESIDILPTIADILGISLPWTVDGQSAFNISIPERTKKFFFRSTKDKKDVERLIFRPVINEKSDTLEQMIALFGSGVKPDGLFRIGPHNNLVGQHVSEIEVVGGSGIMVEFDQERLYEHVDLNAPFVPAQITGRILMGGTIETPLNLAVSINGIIRAVTRTYPLESGMHEWSAIVPELSFRPGKNDIEVFHIAQDARRLRVERTRRKSTVTYFLSASGGQDGKTITTSEGRSIPVIPGALQGFLDRARISNDRIKFSGWAADIKNSELPNAILIFFDGKLVYSGRTNTQRIDVAHQFNNAALQRAGFSYALLLEDFKGLKDPDVRIFAVSKKGVAAELNYPKNYKWTKKMAKPN